MLIGMAKPMFLGAGQHGGSYADDAALRIHERPPALLPGLIGAVV